MSRGHLAAALAAAVLTFSSPAVASAQSFPLAGWWPLNDGSGQTVRDWSGRGNHGFLGSTPSADANDPPWIKGVFLGSALRFDGVDDFVTIPSSEALEPARLTVAGWVRGDSPGAFRYVMAKGSFSCRGSSYGMYTASGGGLSFYIASNRYDYFYSPQAPASMWDGKWHHVAGTFDGSTVRLYVDGVQVGDGTPAPTSIDYDIGDDGGQIGAYPGDCGSDSLTLAGDIDGVQIWSQALPVDSIWRTLKSIVSLAR